MGYIIPASRSFNTSPLITSFILGFKHLCIYRTGLDSSSRYMRCVHMRGLMPWRSAIVQPKAFLCFFSTCNKDSSWPSNRLEDMTTGYDSPSPRKAYLSVESRGFLSGIGGFSYDGTSLTTLGIKGSKVGVQWPICMTDSFITLSIDDSLDPTHSNSNWSTLH